MTLIRRQNPFGELMSLRQAMDRLFEDSYVRPRGGGSGEEHPLALDVYATQDSLVVEAALPGVKPDDVDISVLGDTLTITASSRSEQTRDEEGYSYREIRRGSFSRTVTLPSGLKTDAATASFENGLLRLSFPKAEESKPRQIHIRPTTEGQSSSIGSGEQGQAGAQSAESGGQWGQGGQSAQSGGQSGGQWSQSGESGEYGESQTGESGRSGQTGGEWQSTSRWQSGDQWQSTGQGSSEQPRVEQGS